jgi:hypothetical protein
MKPISEKINYSLEETILEKLFTKGIKQVIDRVRDQVYYDVQHKIHMDVRESLYTKVKQNTLI